MKQKKKIRIKAWLLAAVMLADLCGSSIPSYAALPAAKENLAAEHEIEKKEDSSNGQPQNLQEKGLEEADQSQNQEVEGEKGEGQNQAKELESADQSQNQETEGEKGEDEGQNQETEDKKGEEQNQAKELEKADQSQNQETEGEKREDQARNQESEGEKKEVEGQNTEDVLQDLKQEPVPEAQGANTPEEAFAAMLQEYELYGVLTNAEQITIYQSSSQDAQAVQNLPSGYQVRVLGAVLEESGIWYQIAFGIHDREFTGFVQEHFVLSQDARIDEWKEQWFSRARARSALAVSGANQRGSTDLAAFPSSYRSYIKKLISAHPNWTFVPMNTGLKWAEVVKNEVVDARNLVYVTEPLLWKSTAARDYDMTTGKWKEKDGHNWVQASDSIIKYYLDPRNFLNEESVFQFEQLTYNGAFHTEAGVEKILSNTFMSQKKLEDGSGGGITYARAFMQIGKELKVSPYFLASRVRQEQGVKGDSPLISGKYPGYKGYYNYFNISATGLGDQVIVNGLKEAKAAGWTTRYAALYGGAKKAAENYISKGQDTFYLQKFDVDDSYYGLYWHQYMQNLLAADNEGKNVRKSYDSMGAINNKFVFKVPVYSDMPSSAYPKPGDTLSAPSLTVVKDGYNQVNLSWSEVSGAQGYQVYRKEGTNGTYSRIRVMGGLEAISCQDKNISPGKNYYYKVRAYYNWKEGTLCSPYSVEKNANYSVPATSWSKFTVKNYTTIQFSWKKANVAGYQISRKRDSGKYSTIARIENSGTTSFKDNTVLPGHTYTYRIRSYKTIEGKNYYSSYTVVKKAKISMNTPVLKKVSLSGKTKAKLTWKRDTKASGYYIYRSTKKKGGYKKIKKITGNKTIRWTDSGLSKGRTYYYKIRSFVKSSSGSKSSRLSNIRSVTTKGKKR